MDVTSYTSDLLKHRHSHHPHLRVEKLRQKRDSVAYLQSTIWEEKEVIFETSITNDLLRSTEIQEHLCIFCGVRDKDINRDN